MQIGPAAAGAAVLVGAGVAGVGLLVGDVAPVEGGLVHQGWEERPVAWKRGGETGRRGDGPAGGK